MKHSFLDRYSDLDSPIRRFDPRAKLIGFGTALLLVVSEPRGEIHAFLFYSPLILGLIWMSRIPVRFLFKRCLIATPFILMAAALIFLSGSSPVVGETRVLHDDMILVSVSIAIKAYAAVILLTLLTSTDRFHRLLEGLRAFRMPQLLGVLSAFMYRYAFILSDEVMRTARARQSRTPGRLRISRFTVYGNQAATIFLRSWERSWTVYNAMCSRGFTGEFPRTSDLAFRMADLLFLLAFILPFAVVRTVL